MPNWCENRVRLSDNGDNSEQFDKLVKLLDGPNPFNAIYPQPDWKNIPNEDGELPITEDHKDADGKVIFQSTNFPKSGKNDDRWYHWCSNNWGTKWDMCDRYMADIEDGYAEFGFNTAWSPPYGVFDKIKENFPDVGISWFYDEPGMEFAGYLPN